MDNWKKEDVAGGDNEGEAASADWKGRVILRQQHVEKGE
jgi:hypothetical protein